MKRAGTGREARLSGGAVAGIIGAATEHAPARTLRAHRLHRAVAASRCSTSA